VFGKLNQGTKECVGVLTRRKVERIKRKGAQEQNYYIKNRLGIYWYYEMGEPR
jgi:hypothetical protein